MDAVNGTVIMGVALCQHLRGLCPGEAAGETAFHPDRALAWPDLYSSRLTSPCEPSQQVGWRRLFLRPYNPADREKITPFWRGAATLIHSISIYQGLTMVPGMVLGAKNTGKKGDSYLHGAESEGKTDAEIKKCKLVY